MKKLSWYKMIIKSMQDVKFKRLKKMDRHPFAFYWTAWCILLDYGSEKAGVINWDGEDELEVIFEMIDDLGIAEICKILEDMETVKLISYIGGEIKVLNWEKYQVALDLSTKRVQDHRKNKEHETKIDEVILMFNKITNSGYSINTKETRKLISGRLNDDRTLDDMRAVVVNRMQKWGSDQKMKDFIRPSTIFRPSNFDNYINEIPNALKGSVNIGSTIKVRDPYGVLFHITKDQFDQSQQDYYTVVD